MRQPPRAVPAIVGGAPPIGGGLAAWSMHHPVGVCMLALATVVLGGVALQRLGVDLLPHIIYPEVRVRVLDPEASASIVEDRITRQLEEQLAITEDAVSVQSRTSEGRANIDLSFPYGKDIDVALRDASTRLDRARRYLPESIDPPIIYKRDPSQIPIAELVVSSPLRDPIELRSWTDYVLSKWFINLPGVASAEVGGGLVREIQVLPDQHRLAGLGLDIQDLTNALRQGNIETPAGKLNMDRHQIAGRTTGRFRALADIEALSVALGTDNNGVASLPLREIAEVVDGHQEEELRIRLNGRPGVKLSVQKQPQANTVAVADRIRERLEWLRRQDLIPPHISITEVADQSVFVRRALDNAWLAALGGAGLAMVVVYLFLGDIRRTLIIGSAIPIAVMVTFAIMAVGGLTLNIMTLGGLALGVGMLVDNTIVMLENIVRHQRGAADAATAPVQAAAEVNSAIVASTTTNLAAVLPFLFIGGLTGLLFRELIYTISAAIAASLVVALTLVPALAARVRERHLSRLRRGIERILTALQDGYGRGLGQLIRAPWAVALGFLAAMAYTVPGFLATPQTFLPNVDNAEVWVRIAGDTDVNLDEMDAAVAAVEQIIATQPEVRTQFTSVGGFVFGRTEYLAPNRSRIDVRLVPATERELSTEQWLARLRERLAAEAAPGITIRAGQRGIRGIRLGRGDEDISIRIQGEDLDTLAALGAETVERLRLLPGLRNLSHSAEDVRQELAITVDRKRASALGLTVKDVGDAVRTALQGIRATELIDGDRSIEVRLRLPQAALATPEDLADLLLFDPRADRPIRLGEIAAIELAPMPARILRDQQQRIVEVSGTLAQGADMGQVAQSIDTALAALDLPPGYTRYDAGGYQTLQEGRRLSQILVGLALFLVLVVMAVQYESLRNPIVILLSVPFALIGVAIGIEFTALPLSMPVWLGLIMLAGIVVNNAIVLIEYIEIERNRGREIEAAIIEAGRLRLRPILMTTLTTVVGMTPLAVGLGEGTELLRPLAVTIVAGLSFSMLVSLLLAPAIYRMFAAFEPRPGRLP